MNNKTVLIWFRNDLRIQDNEMLSRASERGENIVPVYCFDPRHFRITEFNTRKTGVNRAKFIIDSVKRLKEYFESQNGNLIVKVGFPEVVIPALVQKYQVDEVYHHREVAQEETHISSLTEDALWRIKINLRHFIGHTLFHKEDFPFPVRDIPNSFTVFRKKLERESFIRDRFMNSAPFVYRDALENTPVPSLEALGFDPSEVEQLDKHLLIGGEDQGLLQLKGYLKHVEQGKRQAVNLSPWLALGCISVHTVYFSVMESSLSKKLKESILQGLWWKDYYRFMFKKYGNLFFQEKGFTGKAPERSDKEDAAFESWRKGNTSNQQVNKIMTQLNKIGYIDFKSREQAASYLIHCLQVNWLRGAAYFEEKLVDYNPSSNYGNWAHLAGVGSSMDHNQYGYEPAV